MNRHQQRQIDKLGLEVEELRNRVAKLEKPAPAPAPPPKAVAKPKLAPKVVKKPAARTVGEMAKTAAELRKAALEIKED